MSRKGQAEQEYHDLRKQARHLIDARVAIVKSHKITPPQERTLLEAVLRRDPYRNKVRYPHIPYLITENNLRKNSSVGALCKKGLLARAPLPGRDGAFWELTGLGTEVANQLDEFWSFYHEFEDSDVLEDEMGEDSFMELYIQVFPAIG